MACACAHWGPARADGPLVAWGMVRHGTAGLGRRVPEGREREGGKEDGGDCRDVTDLSVVGLSRRRPAKPLSVRMPSHKAPCGTRPTGLPPSGASRPKMWVGSRTRQTPASCARHGGRTSCTDGLTSRQEGPTRLRGTIGAPSGGSEDVGIRCGSAWSGSGACPSRRSASPTPSRHGRRTRRGT